MLCDKKHSHVQWRDFKMNVLVCDDDQQIVDSIIEELKKKSEETHVASRFYGFSQPSQIDLSLPYDIALLDIDMGETNGIELARKLRAENGNIVIIFITNFIQYAPEGFEVQAFRYLLKADFSAKLDSYFDSAVQEVLQRKQLVTISINSEIIDGGKICSRGDIIEYLWDNQLYVDDNALSVNINRIREKLASIGLTDFIKTKHRQGYTI